MNMSLTMDEYSRTEEFSTPYQASYLGCFSMSGALCKKLKAAAHNDWLSMVMPSILTKSFGRTLMVLHIIHYTTPLDFIWQNFIYAAWPIAIMSGLIVGTYRFFEALKQNKTYKEAFNIGASFFIKTAVKFFVVYMSWVSSVALVTALGWFSAPITAPVIMTITVCLAALIFLVGLKYLIRVYLNNKILENFIDFLTVAFVFATVAFSAYFIGPVIMGLLIIGGITALSLFCASFITDVLTDPDKNIGKAWAMLSRAYTEGVVWALIEHIGLHAIIGGVVGQVVDVFCVASSVCLAIFVGGQIDASINHLLEANKKPKGEIQNEETKISENCNSFFYKDCTQSENAYFESSCCLYN